MTTQAIVLVGGKGTRLGSMTAETPKPLLQVGGRPFVDYLMGELARFGFVEIVLLAGYLGDRFEPVVERWHGQQGMSARLVVEPAPSGTAGAILHAADWLDDSFLLMNGDTFFDINLLDLARHLEPGLLGALALRAVPDGSRYGTVALQDGRIRALREKGAQGESLINGGVYVLSRALVDLIGKIPCSLEQDVLPGAAANGLLAGTVYGRPFIDIGVPDDFGRAQTFVPAVTCRPTVVVELAALTESSANPVPSTWRAEAVAGLKRLNDIGCLVALGVSSRPGRQLEARYDCGETVRQRVNNQLRPAGAHVDMVVDTESGTGLADALSLWCVDQHRTFTIIAADENERPRPHPRGVPTYTAPAGDWSPLLDRILLLGQ